MTGSTPRPGPGSVRPPGLRWSWWNLLLLLPLFMLVTPWFNHDEPRVLGMPVFYWSQFLWVVVGVVSVFLVYRMTNDRDTTTPVPEPEPGVDTLDEATVGGTAVTTTADTTADTPADTPAATPADPVAETTTDSAATTTTTDEEAAR
jgi:cytoskeletal protein RodZ